MTKKKERVIAKTIDDFIKEANSVGGGRHTIGVNEEGEPFGNIHIDIYFNMVQWYYCDLGTFYTKSLHFLTGGKTNIRLNNVQGVEFLCENYDGSRIYAITIGDTEAERIRFRLNPPKQDE